VYSLSAFAAAAALGLAAGLALAWWPCRRWGAPRGVATGVLLAGAAWLLAQLASLPALVAAWQHVLTDVSRSFGGYLAVLAKTAGFSVGVPCLLAGVALQGVRQRRCRRMGTLPEILACAAALAVGMALGCASVSYVSAETFLRVAALWFGALSGVSPALGFLERKRAWALAGCVPLALTVAVLFVLGSQKPTSVYSEGVIGRLIHRDSGFAVGKPQFSHASFRHTVAVYGDPDYQFVFALDGRPVLFGNRFHTARTLTGYIPLLVRPRCKKAAVLGAEAGLYAPFYVRAGVADVTCALTDADVKTQAIKTDAFLTGNDACKNAVIGSAVRLAPGGNYDVLLLADDPVWMRGTASRYSRAWFERCSRALSADGIVALHVDARALLPERFASLAGDFASVFPGVQLWCVGAYDWILVGGTCEIKTPMDKMLGLFERTAVFRDFVRAGDLALPETLACMLCDRNGLASWLAKTRHLSAWRAEWLATARLFRRDRGFLQPAMLESCRQWKAQWILPGEMDLDVFLALMDKVGKDVGARVAAVRMLGELSQGRNELGLEAAREAARTNSRDALLIAFGETLELEGRRRVNLGDLKGGLKCFENLLSFSSGSAFSHYGMGLCLRGTGDNENAYFHFARAVAAAPEQVDYRLELAQSALDTSRFAEADRQYQEALKRDPDNPAVLFLAAKAQAWHGRPQKDMERALKWAERACVLTKWKNPEYAYGLADLYMDAGKVLEGMGLKRRLKEGSHPAAPVAP